MMFIFEIPERSVKACRLPITEKELYEQDREQLKDFVCPHCRDKGFMFRDFVSITCKSCEWHNGLAEVEKFNEGL